MIAGEGTGVINRPAGNDGAASARSRFAV